MRLQSSSSSSTRPPCCRPATRLTDYAALSSPGSGPKSDGHWGMLIICCTRVQIQPSQLDPCSLHPGHCIVTTAAPLPLICCGCGQTLCLCSRMMATPLSSDYGCHFKRATNKQPSVPEICFVRQLPFYPLEVVSWLPSLQLASHPAGPGFEPPLDLCKNRHLARCHKSY